MREVEKVYHGREPHEPTCPAFQRTDPGGNQEQAEDPTEGDLKCHQPGDDGRGSLQTPPGEPFGQPLRLKQSANTRRAGLEESEKRKEQIQHSGADLQNSREIEVSRSTRKRVVGAIGGFRVHDTICPACAIPSGSLRARVDRLGVRSPPRRIPRRYRRRRDSGHVREIDRSVVQFARIHDAKCIARAVDPLCLEPPERALPAARKAGTSNAAGADGAPPSLAAALG